MEHDVSLITPRLRIAYADANVKFNEARLKLSFPGKLSFKRGSYATEAIARRKYKKDGLERDRPKIKVWRRPPRTQGGTRRWQGTAKPEQPGGVEPPRLTSGCSIRPSLPYRTWRLAPRYQPTIYGSCLMQALSHPGFPWTVLVHADVV